MRYYVITMFGQVLGYVSALSTFGAIRNWMRLNPGCSEDLLKAEEADY